MDGPREYYGKWSRSDKERKILYDLTFMWNLNVKQSKIETDMVTEKKLVAARGKVGREMDKIGEGD